MNVLVLLERDRAVGEAGDANLRALQVAECGDAAAVTLGCLAHRGSAGMMVGRAVGKIQPYHVDTGVDEFIEHALAITGGAQGSDDLGAAKGDMAVQGVRHEKLLTTRYCLYKVATIDRHAKLACCAAVCCKALAIRAFDNM